MKKHLIQFSIAAIFCSAITIPSLHAQKALSRFVINGTITGVKDGTIVRLADIEQQLILDSAYVKNEKFTLKGHVGGPTLCYLKCDKEYATILVENVAMKFTSPLKNMWLNHRVTGGPEQTLQNKLNNAQREYGRLYKSALDSLNSKLYANDEHKKRLIKTFNDNQNAYMKIYIDFGKQHINSTLGLDIVYRNRKTIPKDTMVNLYRSLTNRYKNEPKAKALNTFLTEQVAEVGKPLVDFEVKTIAGKPFRLSSLKGKYIFMSFGSLGCGPCRMENQEIREKYDRLSKLIEFVYFSLDKNREYWEKITKDDKIVWTNISDMEGDYGRIKTIYGVQSMPTSFLIDKNGIIIKKIEAYDTETLTQLEMMFNKQN